MVINFLLEGKDLAILVEGKRAVIFGRKRSSNYFWK
jgi:hypothetical protein